jgi:hypothetical protein
MRAMIARLLSLATLAACEPAPRAPDSPSETPDGVGPTGVISEADVAAPPLDSLPGDPSAPETASEDSAQASDGAPSDAAPPTEDVLPEEDAEGPVAEDVATAEDLESASDDGAAPDAEAPEPCVTDEAFFETRVWTRVVGPICTTCHRVDGLAANSAFRMEPSVNPDYLAVNRARLADLSRTERDGVPTLLLKPAAEMPHGGGRVIARDSEAWNILTAFIERTRAPSTCVPEAPPDPWLGVTLEPAEQTFRRAALLLSGRLPTSDERARLRSAGEAALPAALDALLSEDTFVNRFAEFYDDLLLTERLASSNRANGIMDATLFPNRAWYDAITNESVRTLSAARANQAIGRQPIELVRHIVRNRRPFTEVLTADYMMVNDYSAVSFGLTTALPDVSDPRTLVYRPVPFERWPVAGLLTTPAYLNRYPSTPTNRNRHRSRIFFDRFLATDILALADRPIDPLAGAYHNPTLNDPQCTVCHAMMDPVAGLFQNWDDVGRRRVPELGWYPDLRTPGFGETALPSENRFNALQWLAQQAVADPRFALATTQNVFQGLFGRPPLRPVDPADPEASELAQAMYALQRQTFVPIADAFVASGHEVRVIVRQLVLSPLFRAAGVTEAATPAARALVGRDRLLTPEELNRKVTATTGFPWRSTRTANDFLTDRYRLLYGGIDFDTVTRRLEDPNGLMVGVAERLAFQHACRVVPRDFAMRMADRRLFPHVERTYVPLTADDFEVPRAADAIRRNIVHLHDRILGETLPSDHPEIEATWQLFMQLWRDGRAARAAGTASRDIVWGCQAREDFVTGDALPADRIVSADDEYTLRAWMGVLVYLMTDYRFLYE